MSMKIPSLNKVVVNSADDFSFCFIQPMYGISHIAKYNKKSMAAAFIAAF